MDCNVLGGVVISGVLRHPDFGKPAYTFIFSSFGTWSSGMSGAGTGAVHGDWQEPNTIKFLTWPDASPFVFIP